MPTGIGASIVTLTNGTTANAPDVMSSLNAINAAGISNDSGNITTNGSGILALPGLSLNPTAVQVTGSVSGTATLYQLFYGAVKLVVVSHANYRSAAAQTLALPTAFSSNSYWWTTDYQGGKVEALASGTAQTFSVLTALALAGGTQNPQTALNGYSQGMCRTAFDTVRITVTGASNATGLTIILGV